MYVMFTMKVIRDGAHLFIGHIAVKFDYIFLYTHKLQQYLLFLLPLFLSEDCQKIIDYLMRNYNVHVF